MKEYIVKNINVKVRYHDLPGDGVPIIFIHGLGCASSFDYPQVASLSDIDNHRRILIDLLGSGFSDKPEQFSYSIGAHADYLEDLINDLELKEFFIYGHSMGGAVSVTLAARFDPVRLKGLILSEANLDSGGGFFSKKIAGYTELEYKHSGHSRIVQESKMESNDCWAASLAICSPVAMHRSSASLIEGQAPSWRDVLYSLKTNKTYIFGHHSLPDPDVDELESNNINIEIVPEAGHSMAWENPEGLASAIMSAVASK